MKIRNEIEELFFKPNNIFKDDMDKLKKKKKEMTDKRLYAKSVWFEWYGWLINYILWHMRAVLKTKFSVF